MKGSSVKFRGCLVILTVAALSTACGGSATSTPSSSPSSSGSELSPEEIQKMYDEAAEAAKTEDPNSPNDLTIKGTKPASSMAVSWKTDEGYSAKASLKVYGPKEVADSSSLCSDVDAVTSPDQAALSYTVVLDSEDTSPAGFSWPSTQNVTSETMTDSSITDGQIVDVDGVTDSDGTNLGQWATCIDGQVYDPSFELPHFGFGTNTQFTVFTLASKTPDHPKGAWQTNDLALRIRPAAGITYTEKDGGCKEGVPGVQHMCQVLLAGKRTG